MRGIWALWLFLSLIAGAGRVLAQDQDVNGRIGEVITLEMVQAAEARLEEMTHLDDAALDQVKAIYGKIREQLRMADDWHSQVNEYELLLSQSQDDRLEEIQTAIADLASEKPWSISDEDSLSQLEQMLARAEAEMESARQAMAGVVGVQQRREDRRNLVPQALAEARDRFEGLSGGGGSGGDDDVELLTARDWLVLARRQSILEEIRTYELELQSDSVRGDLLANELQLSQHIVIQAEARTKLWRERVLERREMEARQAEEEARSAAERAIKGHVAVRDAAERNAVLAGLRVGPDGLVEQLKKASRLADQVRRELTELQDQKRRVEGRVAAAGTNYTIGQFLVDRRRELPDLRAHERSVTTRSDIIAEIRLSRIEQREETAQFVSLDDRVKDLLLPERVEDHADVGIALRSELETRVSLLQDLGRDLDAYLDLLYDLDASERALISQTEEFAAYIDERVLWVRIAPPVISDPIGLWKKGVDALSWLLDGSAWRDLAGDVGRRLLSHPLVYGLQVLLLGLLVSVRPTLRVRLLETANLVTRVRTDRLVHTIKALFLTLALAVIIPVMIWCAAGLLSQASPASALAQAGAAGLRSVAGLLLVTGFLTRAFRENGLAEHHFRWKRESLSLVRGQLRLLLTILVPALFIVRALEWEGMPAHTESLGSLAFCVMQVSVCLFAVRVLHPQSGVFAPIVEEHPDGWVSRLRWLWYPVAIGLPILLLVLSLMGYLYTAHQFQVRLTSTLLLVGGLCLFHAVALRVLRATERRLALQQYIKRREASQEAADQGHLFDDEGLDELAEEEIDVGLVTGQSRRLVQIAVAAALFFGTWVIWSDVLPAVRVAGDVPLWSHQVEAWEQVRMPDGTLRTQSYIELQPVTLLDLLVASALLVLAFVAARNLPGLLEMLILRHLPIQRAGRYAITTLVRYLIVLVGLILAFGSLGMGWEKVQWLAAAVTVGLGFGLQEIFANFVSGLILLFERPMRVGDTVTVGEITGTVTRIQMRATTIATWDRTELVVPNKEFITNQLTNWTLSDSVLRVVLQVGVAYGSDTAHVTKILERVALDCEDVLEDPPPRVVFTAFGDSTLDFELRCYTTSPELYRRIQDPLNKAIDRSFRKAGIEIAFPQRDLHLRTSPETLKVAVAHSEASDVSGT